MIIKSIDDNIFNTDAKHIAFAINKEGANDCGFAGTVGRDYWPEVMYCGEHEIGTVLSKKVGDVTFHALVCHSLKEGWGDDQAKVIKECFDNIPVNDEPIASIAIGTGLVGQFTGANFRSIACGMQESKQKVILHSCYTLEEINEWYKERKGTAKKKSLNNK